MWVWVGVLCVGLFTLNLKNMSGVGGWDKISIYQKKEGKRENLNERENLSDSEGSIDREGSTDSGRKIEGEPERKGEPER